MSISKTVIISCAGIGNRLGLGQPKALIDIMGRPLIHWLLDMLEEESDVRIVVGYQAKDVIKTVLQVRSNVTFVFNHDYFHTKTASSVYLASLFAHDYIFVLDGDVVIHPQDLQDSLNMKKSFIGITKISSEESVLTTLKNNKVISFSRKKGDYEWIGPAFLKKDIFSYSKDKHLYQVIEKNLPINCKKVRSMDIDTMDDYYVALEKFKKWRKI
jgi:choline kinase